MVPMGRHGNGAARRAAAIALSPPTRVVVSHQYTLWAASSDVRPMAASSASVRNCHGTLRVPGEAQRALIHCAAEVQNPQSPS